MPNSNNFIILYARFIFAFQLQRVWGTISDTRNSEVTILLTIVTSSLNSPLYKYKSLYKDQLNRF